MTDRARVYTPKELAELAAEHDREHPDHGDKCNCHNGIISMLRTYFMPIEQPLFSGPKPYIPPDLEVAHRDSIGTAKKVWMQQGEGETKEQYDWRTSHSCYNCGIIIEDRERLNVHEDNCSAQGRRCGP